MFKGGKNSEAILFWTLVVYVSETLLIYKSWWIKMYCKDIDIITKTHYLNIEYFLFFCCLNLVLGCKSLQENLPFVLVILENSYIQLKILDFLGLFHSITCQNNRMLVFIERLRKLKTPSPNYFGNRIP